MNLTIRVEEPWYFGLCLEGFLFGLYSGIFAILWHQHAAKEETDNTNQKQNIIFYALCILYMLSVVDISLDIAALMNAVLTDDIMVVRLSACQIAVFACCDFITQSILIHRCWIMWDRNIRIVIIPSILAFAFLVMWIAQIGSLVISPSGLLDQTRWGNTLGLTGVTASMAVNTLVTALIMIRIFQVFHQIKSIITTSAKQSLSTHAGGRKLRSVIFIIIESGMVLFAIQLTRVVIGTFAIRETVNGEVYDIIIVIHEMLNGIIPTLTLLRVSMGLSFHDEPSFVEAVSASFQFVVGDPNPIPLGMGRSVSLRIKSEDSISIPTMSNTISQERRDNDIGVSDGIQMVDRL